MSVLNQLLKHGHQKIYVAGPMRGIPEFNYPRFHAVTKVLRAQGHTVFSPAEKDNERHGKDISKGNTAGDIAKATADHGFSLREALCDDLTYICKEATAICLLPGWENSSGSMAEHRTAVALKVEGMSIVYLTEDECEMIELVASRMDHTNAA